MSTISHPDPVPRPLVVSLDVSGRACVVFGGGEVGTRRAVALLAAGAAVTVISPTLSPQLMELVQAGRVDWYPRMADRRDTADAFLAVAATSSEETNRDVASWCRKAGILCNQAADAHEGDVQFPMQKQFGPITVAVQSGDAGPLISRMVLEWIADNFDSDILRLSEIASEIRRELGKSISSQPQRREALRSVLQNEKVLALVRENRMREARDEAMKCISTLLG